MGNKVKDFESAFADFIGRKHFVMMNSGSSANLAMLEVLMRGTSFQDSLKAGDGVLVPSIAWPTTVWPILQLGLRPIFVDVESDTFGIDLSCADKLLKTNRDTVKARAIFPIHPLGYPLNPNELREFCMKHELLLIEDCCESLGAAFAGENCGSAGIASSFSFYFSHHMTTMEGGGVATDSTEFANDLISVRAHGWSRGRSDVERHIAGRNLTESRFTFLSSGFNFRPMEIQGAIGLSQLQDLPAFIKKRRAYADFVSQNLEGTIFWVNGIQPSSSEILHSHMLLAIGIKSPFERAREEILSLLEAQQVETRPVLTGNFTRQPAFMRYRNLVHSEESFPNSDYIDKTFFLVGNHHDLKNRQRQHLIEVLKAVSSKVAKSHIPL